MNAAIFVVEILEGQVVFIKAGEVMQKCVKMHYKTKILLLESYDTCQEVWKLYWGLCILKVRGK
jgi:hypothetical protein